jgi:hypothetical protein
MNSFEAKPMSPIPAALPATIPQAIWDTLLGRLAPLFLIGAAGDPASAREAAHQMLAAYNPQTSVELRLAAEIIGFGLHALEALGQAADPALSLNRVLRLRGSAVSLSREAHKSQRKLDQLQRAHAIQPPAQAQPSPQPEPAQDHPGTQTASPTEAECLAARTKAKIWLQSYNEREAAERIAKNLMQNQVDHAARAASLSPAPAITRAA